MKRNIDLIRRLLLDIEAMPAGEIYETQRHPIKGHDQATIQAHFRLIKQAGLIEGAEIETNENGFCLGLTWEGHEFLEAIRSETILSRVKTRIKDAGLSVPLEILRELAAQLLRDQLGLR